MTIKAKVTSAANGMSGVYTADQVVAAVEATGEAVTRKQVQRVLNELSNVVTQGKGQYRTKGRAVPQK